MAWFRPNRVRAKAGVTATASVSTKAWFTNNRVKAKAWIRAKDWVMAYPGLGTYL